MLLIDLIMVGKLGASAIAGVGLGSSIYYVFAVFSVGVLFALDPLVAHAVGRRQIKECHHWLWQGLYLSLFLSVPMVLGLEALSFFLLKRFYAPEVAVPAQHFLSLLSLSLPSFLLFITFRQYLQAMSSVRPGSILTILAIGSNILLNWIFIFGHWNCPALGVAGAGLATLLTRTLMAIALIAYTFYRDKKLALGLTQVARRFHSASLTRLLRIGIPTGLQFGLEVGVFTLVTSLISGLGVISTASHTIVVNISSFTYTVPMGLAGATAILVGQQTGSQNFSGVRHTGWISIGLSMGVMAISGASLTLFGASVARFFTTDLGVAQLSSRLIFLAALFQIADGIQSVGGGALRGLGDTRSSMFANLIGYWIVGLPLGGLLCFKLNLGAFGFWIGLTVGLYFVAAIVLRQWFLRSGQIGEFSEALAG